MVRKAARSRKVNSLAAVALLGAVTVCAVAKDPPAHRPSASFASASHVIIPQRRAFDMGSFGEAVLIDSVAASVKIIDRTATTTLDIALRNPGSRRAEAILLLPVPDGAAVGSFMFDGASSEPTARVLPREEARRIYDEIVNQVRDPALLEFAGYNLIRTSVFPLEARGSERVRLTYEHLLSGDGDRVDYVLPRSEALDQQAQWDISVEIAAHAPISIVYSPSHELTTQRIDAKRARVELSRKESPQPGPFILSYLTQTNGVSASLFAYPDPTVGNGDGGYFLLMTGMPASLAGSEHRQKREITIVIDRSGSMAGEKMDQVRAAALQLIEGLEEGEAFNILDYSNTVSSFAPAPVEGTRENILAACRYLESIRPTGGTNIHDALLEALRQPVSKDTLPLVLFLTDGLPTVGKTSEVDIREMVERANEHDRRVFVIGVGADVNAPLLDRIVDATGAPTTMYVLPGENVEVKVALVFKQLYGPVLSKLSLVTVDESGAVTTRRVRERIPALLPDFFEGDQLIVLGQYLGDDPLKFIFEGDFFGERRRFAFDFRLDDATTRNAFVPRLWASRRIAYLVDEIRQRGADSSGDLPLATSNLFDDPRFRELTDEILRLSTEFGILTEYTAFLATEGTNLSNWNELRLGCGTQLDNRAVKTRSGIAAASQSLNYNDRKWSAHRNYSNIFVDENLNVVEITNVQQVCDRAFFKRGNDWIDGRIVAQKQAIRADEVIDFGSEAHHALLARLITENRQGAIALSGDIYIHIDDRTVLIRNTTN